MPKTIKPSWLFSLALILASSGAFANPTAPLPTVDEIVTRALERGKTEVENEQLFKEQYYFVRSRHTEIRNSKGDVKKLKIRISTNAPIALVTNTVLGAPPPPATVAPKQTRGKTPASPAAIRKAEKEEHLKFGKELVKRYDFKLVGREVTNGASLLVVDFTPKNEKLPEKDLRDRVVNRMAGRIWLDEREYAVKRCTMQLTRSLKIIGGIVGEAHKFNFMFERERTEDGLWYVAQSNWHLEGRQVVVYREADYQEKRTEVRKRTHPESGGLVQIAPAMDADQRWDDDDHDDDDAP